MYSDDSVRELAAVMRENTAANLELAAAIRHAAGRLSPTAGMGYAELIDLAEKQLLKEPPAFDPNTHQGRVEECVREMVAVWQGTGE